MKPASKKAYIGAHSSITPSILSGIEYMNELGANAVQIFTGPSQSSSLRVKQKVEEPEKIKNYLKRNKIKLIIHAIYTLNFCSAPATSKRIKYAQDNLIYDLELAERIGACCVVVHIGSQGTLDRATAYSNMADNVRSILSATATTAPNVMLALETPAGQGKQIAATLDELSELWNMCIAENNQRRRLGFCIDTAHLFSSGIDIRSAEQFIQYLQQFDKLIGTQHIACFHLNDSKADLNSRRDIHQGIGDGYLFGKKYTGPEYLKTIKALATFASKHGIPVILETHSAASPDKPGGELYAQEIALLNQLITEKKIPAQWQLIHQTGTPLKTKKSLALGKMKSSTHKAPMLMQTATNPANIGLLGQLKRIQDYYTFVEPDKFRALAYGKAIITLRGYPEEILQGSQVAHLPGVGSKMVDKINEYLTTGTMKIFAEENINAKFTAWEEKQQEYKKQNIESILGFGPAKVKGLARKNIRTITELRNALTAGDVKLSSAELVGLQYHEDLMHPVKRDETKAIFDALMKALTTTGVAKKYGLHPELAGSYPSGKAQSKDIDVLIFSDKYPDADEKIPQSVMTEIETVLRDAGLLLATVSIGSGKILGIIRLTDKHSARHIDIRLLPSGATIFGRLYFTSGRDFNQMIRAHAKQQGYKLNEFGLYDLRRKGERVQGLDSEESVMEHIGMAYVPMNKRR